MAMAISHVRRLERRTLLLGVDDPWIAAGLIFMFGSGVACVIYGIWKWNAEEED
ncbi:MAG TPA: hypothetical protein VMB46_05525 [Methanomassiliicoccales archaeon]|nr:hypothetical protein [Methanomassiliicoccales archaeon]